MQFYSYVKAHPYIWVPDIPFFPFLIPLHYSNWKAFLSLPFSCWNKSTLSFSQPDMCLTSHLIWWRMIWICCQLLWGVFRDEADSVTHQNSTFLYAWNRNIFLEEIPEPGFSVANDPSNYLICQKIVKNVISEKPNWNVWWKDLLKDLFIGENSLERSF